MRAVHLAFVSFVATLAMPVGIATASTCTAPGHPSCTITCPAGCGAIYSEPNGPCRTMCSRSAAKADDSKAAESTGLSSKDTMDLLAGKAGTATPMSKAPKK